MSSSFASYLESSLAALDADDDLLAFESPPARAAPSRTSASSATPKSAAPTSVATNNAVDAECRRLNAQLLPLGVRPLTTPVRIARVSFWFVAHVPPARRRGRVCDGRRLAGACRFCREPRRRRRTSFSRTSLERSLRCDARAFNVPILLALLVVCALVGCV